MTEVFVVSEGPFGSKLKRTIAGLGAAASMAACGGQEPAFKGYRVETDSQQEWTHEEDVEPRVRAMIDAELEKVNAPPDAMDGVTVKIVDGYAQCRGVPPSSQAGGCTDIDQEIQVSTRDATCAEGLPVAHEALHQILWRTTGDSDHTHRNHPELWNDVEIGTQCLRRR